MPHDNDKLGMHLYFYKTIVDVNACTGISLELILSHSFTEDTVLKIACCEYSRNFLVNESYGFPSVHKGAF